MAAGVRQLTAAVVAAATGAGGEWALLNVRRGAGSEGRLWARVGGGVCMCVCVWGRGEKGKLLLS